MAKSAERKELEGLTRPRGASRGPGLPRPSPEPKPGEAGWVFRVLEPYYSRECVDNARWPSARRAPRERSPWPGAVV